MAPPAAGAYGACVRRESETSPGAASAQSLYAVLMKERFAPYLREAGFRGSGGRFRLPSESHWAQVGFQKSVYSDRRELRFTVNLSCVSQAEWESQRAAKPYLSEIPRPGTFYGKWVHHTRLGALVPDGGDKWWSLSPGQDPEPVVADLLHDLENYGIPWLRATSSHA